MAEQDDSAFTAEELSFLREILAAPESHHRPLLREFAAAILARAEGESEGTPQESVRLH